ncbi:MAG: cyclase family protein [Acidobacteria bacterium]|nr:cyclase family protein [Acidobacteriota bacterium]
MKRTAQVGIALVAVGAWVACSSPAPEQPAPAGFDLSKAEVVDLTHSFDADTIYWPTGGPFSHEQSAWGVNEKGFFYSSFDYASAEHLGTHADAPIHFGEGKRAVDEVPISQWVGRAAVLDVAAACASNPDYLINAADIAAYEGKHGPIRAGDIVLARTDWSRFWPDTKKYMGDDTPGATDNLHFPGFGEDAARALAERGVHAVGIDTASIDHGPSTEFLSHRALAAAQIPLLENLTGLDQVPAEGAWIIALPMKIGGGSGAPLRIVALK